MSAVVFSPGRRPRGEITPGCGHRLCVKVPLAARGVPLGVVHALLRLGFDGVSPCREALMVLGRPLRLRLLAGHVWPVRRLRWLHLLQSLGLATVACA